MAKSLVLIADIESSREIQKEEREKLQQNLQEALDAINQRGGEGLLSPYTLTLGDEFQAVYENADYLFRHILKIMAEVHPIKIRFSLAIGDIDTQINTEQAIGMDGPAFHEAREGIEILKESGYLFNIRVEGEETPNLNVANGSLQLIGEQMRGWSKKRLKILYMLKEGHDYKSITKELDISQSAFYKNKDAGMLDVIDKLSNNMAEIINQKLGR